MPLTTRISSSLDDAGGGGGLRCEMTGDNMLIDPRQVVFKTSSMAVLRAKQQGGCISEGEMLTSGAILILQAAFRMWKQGVLCDVTIACSDLEVKAHKVVLAAYSDPLAERFQDFSPSTEISLDFTDFDSKIIIAVLTFMYTTDIDINFDSVADLLKCALEMEVPAIVKLCMDFLNIITTKNCLHFYAIATKNGLTELKRKILEFIRDHSDELEKGSEFANLCWEDLLDLLGDDDFFASELDAFYALTRWIDHSPAERLPHAPELLRPIRLFCIPPEVLVTEVEVVHDIFAFSECHLQLFEALRYHALKYSGSALAASMHQHEGSRRAMIHIFAQHPLQRDPVSGQMAGSHTDKFHQTRRASTAIQFNNPRSAIAASQTLGPTTPGPPPSWGASPQPPPRGGVTSPRQPPQQGQGQGRGDRGQGQGPSPRKQQQQQGSPARGGRQPGQDENRNLSANGHVDDNIYHPNTILNPPMPANQHSPYHTPTNQQQPQPPRYQYRQHQHQASSANQSTHNNQKPVHTGETVLLIGGVDMFSVNGEAPGRQIYRYEPLSNHWRLAVRMSDSLHHHAAAYVCGKVYIVGGLVFDSRSPNYPGKSTNQVRAFEPDTGRWYQAPPLREKRAYHGLAVYESSLYAVCGENEEKGCLDTVECYNVFQGQSSEGLGGCWTTIARVPGQGRIGPAVAVHGGSLYVLGGYNRDALPHAVLDDVQCLDLANKNSRWLVKRRLAKARCHAALVDIQGRLYVVGGGTLAGGVAEGWGWDQEQQQQQQQQRVVSTGTVEVYNDAVDAWSLVTELHTPRHDMAVVAMESVMYVLGGLNSDRQACLDEVECFDTAEGRWLNTAHNIPCASAGMAAAVVPDCS